MIYYSQFDFENEVWHRIYSPNAEMSLSFPLTVNQLLQQWRCTCRKVIWDIFDNIAVSNKIGVIYCNLSDTLIVFFNKFLGKYFMRLASNILIFLSQFFRFYLCYRIFNFPPFRLGPYKYDCKCFLRPKWEEVIRIHLCVYF